MSRILIIDDDIELCSTLADMLRRNNYVTEAVHTGREGLDRITSDDFDVLIIDWGLADINGLEICKIFRRDGGKTPILFLTGRADVPDKVEAFQAGTDDYITKPFDARELVARIQAILRRPRMSYQPLLKVGQLELEPARGIAKLAGREIALLPKELALIEFLMRNPDSLFNADVLVRRVWPSDSESSPDVVRVHIGKLREKLCIPGSPSIIVSVRGFGYKLDSTLCKNLESLDSNV